MIITPYTIPVAVAGASPTTVAPTTTMPLATPALVPRHYTYWNGRDIETVNAVTYTLATGFTTYPAVTCLPYSARAPSGKSNSIDAACFTVSGPYHDIPVSATFVVVDKCSTVDGITTTAYSTYYDYWDKDVITTASTVTIEPWVRCSWHLTADHPENCETVSPLGWASLIFTIFTIQVMWWASDIHLLFKPRDKGGGLRAYFDAVVWACIRATSPMSAGAIALHCGDGPAHGARIYYQGVRTSSRGRLFDGRTPNANWRPGRSFKYWISVFTECLTIATATLTMVRACSKEYANIPFSESWWVVPVLPNALVGIFLLVLEFLLSPSRKVQNRWGWFMLLWCLVVGAAILAILWKFDSSMKTLWFVPAVCYFFMTIPLAEFGKFTVIAALLSWAVRVGGVSWAAWHHYGGGQPYCKIPGRGFAIAYMTMGAVTTILGVAGSIVHINRIRKEMRKPKPTKPPEESTSPQATENRPTSLPDPPTSTWPGGPAGPWPGDPRYTWPGVPNNQWPGPPYNGWSGGLYGQNAWPNPPDNTWSSGPGNAWPSPPSSPGPGGPTTWTGIPNRY